MKKLCLYTLFISFGHCFYLSAKSFEYCFNKLEAESSRQSVIKLSYFTSLSEFNKVVLDPDDLAKCLRIRKLIRLVLHKDWIDILPIVNTLKLSKFLRKYDKYNDINSCGYFIDNDNEVSKYPLIISNKRMFINLEGYDEAYKKGGFKSFSRTIDIENEKIYANLASGVSGKSLYKSNKREFDFMTNLKNHTFVTTFVDWQYLLYKNRGGDFVKSFVFQSELYAGDLFKNKKEINEKNSWDILFISALLGLESILQSGFVHRDIKPENILVSKDLSKAAYTDFGFALSRQDPRFGKGIAGTLGYIAPEICNRKQNRLDIYLSADDAEKSEIFSLGLSFYSLIIGWDQYLNSVKNLNKLYLGKNRKSLPALGVYREAASNLTLAYDEVLTKVDKENSLINIIIHMVDPDPASRVSINEIKELIERLNVRVEEIF